MSIATTWGTTAKERAKAYPCDGLIDGVSAAYFRGVTVQAPPRIVFRWLCQLRAAPYSYDWIDNFGKTSPQHLTPGLDDLRVGQRTMRVFDLASFEYDRHITLVLRGRRTTAIFGRLALSYMLDDAGVAERGPTGRRPGQPDDVRLTVKLVVRYPRRPWGWIARVLLPWGDLIMMRKQLMNLKRLAERQARIQEKGGPAP